MEGIRIDAGADIVQLHLCRIADVHAVDFDGSEQQHEGQDHVDGHDDEDGEKGHVPAPCERTLMGTGLRHKADKGFRLMSVQAIAYKCP